MRYLAIVNPETKSVEFKEYYKDKDDVIPYRVAALKDEATRRGAPWAYYEGDKPFAWPTKEEIAEEARQTRVGEIRSRLYAIDAEGIRPARAVAAETASKADLNKLATLESEAAALRSELSTLSEAAHA